MFRNRQWIVVVVVALAAVSCGISYVFAQGNLPVAATGDNVTIKKDAIRVIELNKFRVPLFIEAIQTVTLVAPFDATVKQVMLKANAKTQAQNEIVRMDNTVQKLHLSRAQFAVKIATLELKQADKDELATSLAQAKLELAKIDEELARLVLEQTSIRMPFNGEVQRILVTEGQFVRAGDPIAIVADDSKMKVEIPVDRAAAESGKPFTLKIESAEVDGKVDSVLPLPSKFDGLRELFDSIASVLVVVDNNDHKFRVGQTVYVPMIPRQPVAEVPVSAVGNLPDGNRKVQVVRHSTVRDITVSIMGQVGSTRVFVSGAFSEGDEVIYESSHQLGDAFVLRSAAGAATGTQGGATQPGTNPPTTGNSKTPGF